MRQVRDSSWTLRNVPSFHSGIISERTKAGMEAARVRGSRIGRRPSMTEVQTDAAKRAVEIDLEPISEVAGRYQVHPKTLARILRGVRIE